MQPLFFAQSFSLAFLAILFLQSGLDKVFNYKGNYEWIKSHFSKSPLKGTVGMMMPLITLMEVGAGIFSAIGLVFLIANGSVDLGLIGAYLSSASILALFFGQRIAQDYVGAATLTTYFIISIMTIYLLGL